MNFPFSPSNFHIPRPLQSNQRLHHLAFSRTKQITMDSAPVNWEALDALIIDFAKSENLIEDLFSPSPPSSPSLSCSSYHSRLIIVQIGRSLEAGNFDAAIDLLRTRAPFILDDHRFLFRLQKQQFIELLRRGTAEDRDSAIDCLRTSLAPCALDAYPEAYEEFKHVLLAFIYDKDDQTSPLASEWAERRRFEIAGPMSSVLRVHLLVYDPVFTMTLRYLISMHKVFCSRQGIVSPISDLTKGLLLEEPDLPTTPPDIMYEAPPFDENDIQALAHAVELTRQGAIDSLRFGKGDLFQAFQNELSWMRLDVSSLDELVHEYCIYRGIVDSGLASPSGRQTVSETLNPNQMEPGYSSSKNSFLEVDCIAIKQLDVEPSRSNARSDGSPENTTDVTSQQIGDAEVRYACEAVSNIEDCSTSGSHQPRNSRYLRNRAHGTGERKHWRGRHNEFGGTPDVSFMGSSKQERTETSATSINISKEQQDVENLDGEDKYQNVLGIKELASRGLVAEVVEEINAMDPNFLVQNHILLFQLKQVEFLKLVSSGDHSGALRVACSHLGPLAVKDPAC